MQRLIFFISILAFSASLASQRFAQPHSSCGKGHLEILNCHSNTSVATDHCNSEVESLQKSDQESQQNDQSHHDDCHCPMHRTHCCGSMAMIGKFQRVFISVVETQKRFFRESYLVKPAPFLDGPFQPPRA
jgi:hypothetical protein